MQNILWISKAPLPFSYLQKPPYLLTQAHSLSDISKLSQKTFPIIMADDLILSLHEKEWQKSHPLSVKIFFSKTQAVKPLISALNSWDFFAVLSEKSPQAQIQETLEKALKKHQAFLEKDRLVQNLKEKNSNIKKNLELEQNYNQQALSFQREKKVFKEALKNRKALSLLTKRLSGLTVIDDFFQVIKKELKPFHKIQNLYLLHTDKAHRSFLIFSNTHGLLEEKAIGSVTWLQNSTVHKELADIFKRPFMPTIKIPLLKSPASFLFLEHNMSQEEKKSFSSFLQERLELLCFTFERVLFQEQMRKTASLWEKVFDSLEDPLAVITEDRSVVRANKSFSNEKAKKNCHTLFQGKNEICHNCPLEDTLSTGQFQQKEVVRNNRIYNLHSYPIKSPTHHAPRVAVHHYVDVTHSRKLYTQMLQNEKMIALGKLANHLAHELNNPLTGIRSMAQILSQKKEGEVLEDLKSIEESTKQCQSIIQNLLDFSKEELDFKQISLKDIVNKTLPLLKSVIGLLEREIELDEKKDLITGQPQLLQQVIYNLIKNASQALPKEGGKLEIKTEVLKSTVRFSVKDNGKGIEPSLKPVIFEPFVTTKKKGEGTGLGLYLCKRIIEEMKGHISFETQEQKGSCFYFELPLLKKEKKAS